MPVTQVTYAIIFWDSFTGTELERRAKPAIFASDKRAFGRSETRRSSYFAGRAAVAALFEDQKLDARVKANAEFGYLQVVDPAGQELSSVFVNISHTANVAVAVIGPHPIGIDIESKRRSASRVLSKIIAPEESLILGKPKNRTLTKLGIASELALWTAKEAVSKAVGVGIKFGMKDFVIHMDQSPPFPVTLRRSGPHELSEPAVAISEVSDFVLSICTEKPDLKKTVRGLTLK